MNDAPTKKGRDLAPGDRIINDDNGEVVVIKSVAKGLIENHALVEWNGGWGHVHNSDLVELAP